MHLWLPSLSAFVATIIIGNNNLYLVRGKGCTIEPSLSPRFLGTGTENVMVSFTQGIDPVIQQINGQTFSSPSEKRTALTLAQQSFTNGIQGGLQSVLKTQGVPFQTFWINNRMLVPNADWGLIQTISLVPGVARIEKEKEISVGNAAFSKNATVRLTKRQSTLPWGIERIRANQLWSRYTGKGIVVANIDSGVSLTHESLRGRNRNSYGWFDPGDKTFTPNDQNGHGTHTMGTIAGTHGIGVAPNATWIACKGWAYQTAREGQLISCGQWIQCPTRPDGYKQDCTKAPDVVNNSWGWIGVGLTSYDSIISSWLASGIVPVFSIGNDFEKNDCGSGMYPGYHPKVIGVGAIDPNNRISSFSCLGPAKDGKLKPDIVAPGRAVRSAAYNSDNGYFEGLGTSMAAPHVTGVIALMLQKNPGLTYTSIYNAITGTADRKLDTSTAKTCGGISPSTFPNHVFGYGRIDALSSVLTV